MMNELDCYFHTVTQRYIAQQSRDRDEKRNDFGDHLIVFFSARIFSQWTELVLGTILNYNIYIYLAVQYV